MRSSLYKTKLIICKISKDKIYLAIGVLLFVYVFFRAFFLSMTHDESLSFTIINGDETWKYTANNHLLNTKLMAITQSIFGSSAFSLRLPNVISFIIYLYFSFKLLSKTKNIPLQLLGFSILLFNPFVLDFFSLARGYGISLACSLASIYFLLKQIEIWKTNPTNLRNYFAYLLFASAAMFANLGMINYLIASHLILIVSSRNRITASMLTAFGAISIYKGLLRLLELKLNAQLYFGTNSLKNSFLSILEGSLYGEANNDYLVKIVFALLAISIILGVFTAIKSQDYFNKWTILFAINLVTILGYFIENWLFKANFPMERTAIYLIPLMGLTFIYALDFFEHSIKFTMSWFNLLACLFSIILFIHFIKTSNITHVLTWKYDAHTKEALKIISQDNKDSIFISNYYLFEPTIKYYIKTENLKIKLTGCLETQANPNFVYRFQDSSKIINYTQIKTFPISSSNIMARNK